MVDAGCFRSAISRFATGIVVLSARDDAGGVHGMTINSFTSISLEPPTVLVSLKEGRMKRLIGTGGRCGASVLDASQQGLSAHFSGWPEQTVRPEFVVRDRVPTLVRSLAWFECEIADAIEVHDHTLFVAHVTACGSGEGDPLMFFGSRYHGATIQS